jgi:UDP-N-acetylmuramoylalanine-D-glutamate ligase
MTTLKNLLRRACVAIGAALCLSAFAQTYPAKPVKVVVGYAPGGAVDIVARTLGQGLSASLGQAFVVENKPGAGTNIAVKSVISAEPDGHTLMLAANALAALALCEAIGVAASKLIEPLKSFAGLPHRVETVAEIDGVLYVDDSKGTNVGATLAAIEGMGRKVAIVLGGDGKGQDFSPLKSALEKHGRAVALIGRDAAAIGMALEGCGVPTRILGDMDTAVVWLAGHAQAGDCVLLSPACASLDMYRNYAHRAQAFIDAVKGLSS